MTRMTVLGGTGYTGTNIVREALARGLEVTAVARNIPAEPVEGVTYVTGDAADAATIEAAAQGADVLVSALPPRGPLLAPFREVIGRAAAAAQAAGARLGVVGGAGSLLVAEGGPRVVDGDFPDLFRDEALTMSAVLEDLRASDAGLDWFMVSPAAGYGSYAPGERVGTYRTGGDVLLVDDEGQSFIGGEDFATAFVAEIVTPAHRRARFTVAY